MIAAVEAANELLRAAVIEPSIGNLAALELRWRGEALAKAQAFAQDLSQRYLRPLEVTFVYFLPPRALEGNLPDMSVVISTETWTYTGPQASHSETFEFTYTLSQLEESWVIIDYLYGSAPNIPPPTAEVVTTTSPISVSTTLTTTTVITSVGQ